MMQHCATNQEIIMGRNSGLPTVSVRLNKADIEWLTCNGQWYPRAALEQLVKWARQQRYDTQVMHARLGEKATPPQARAASRAEPEYDENGNPLDEVETI
jgi:hypothetical protein